MHPPHSPRLSFRVYCCCLIGSNFPLFNLPSGLLRLVISVAWSPSFWPGATPRPVWGLPELSRKDQNISPRTPLSRNELTPGHRKLGMNPWDRAQPSQLVPRAACTERFLLSAERSRPSSHTNPAVVSPPCSTQARRVTQCHRRPLCAQGDLMHGALYSSSRGSPSKHHSPENPVLLAIGQVDADGSGMTHWRRLFQTENQP